MLTTIINFANILLAALLVGSMFGVSLVFNPSGLRAGQYTAVQQQGIRTLHPVMPVLGLVTILFTITAAVLKRDDVLKLGMLLATMLCFMATGLITRFRNQPINAIVLTWSVDNPPANWTALRDRWWHWHLVRLGAALGGLSLLIAATLEHVAMA